MDENADQKHIRIATHDGTFHADDVFAVATLVLFESDADIEVIRTREREVYETCDYVVDVGNEYDPQRKRFDHHQADGAGARVNGVPYASFGLVWKEYGAKISSDESAQRLDERMVQTIDGLDNGIDMMTEHPNNFYCIQSLVSVAQPTWKEDDRTHDNGFEEVLPIATYILEREIVQVRDRIEGEQYVKEAYSSARDKRLIVLEAHYPWRDVLTEKSEPLFVLLPHNGQNGNWKVRAVPKNSATFENRKDLPRSWAGKRGEELARVSGVSDAVFCHNKRFIAVARSQEGALALAQKALEA